MTPWRSKLLRLKAGPDHPRQLGRLFSALAYGERLAQRCAQAQAAMAPEPWQSRFLRRQARQEGFHACLFEAAAAQLGVADTQALPPKLEVFGQRLQAALVQRRWLASLAAQQVVLEGLGETILQHLSQGLARRGFGVGRLCRLLLRQEHSHQAFGAYLLTQSVRRDPGASREIGAWVAEFLALAEAIVADMDEVFDVLDETPAEYLGQLRTGVSRWLQGAEH